jgi:parvulin-like peptidyl-prolyl isomerase
VLEVLLEQEAIKQGLRPDSDQVTQKLNSLDEKFTNAESEEERDSWKKDREQVLPIMKTRIERELLVTKLKEQVKNVTTPPVDEVRQYYIDNKDKFTEPQQWDVSIILLTVDPSSSPEVWEETVEKAEKILKKIRKGESFEELARIHSGDESAVDGGHMGYIHIGMLGTPAQKMLNVMEPGELSEPVVLLEGVAIFRLNDVQQANLNTFEDVQERATNLLKRKLGEEAWNKLLKTVRSTADIEYNEAVSNELNVQTVGES